LIVLGLLVGGTGGYYLYDAAPERIRLPDLVAAGWELLDRPVARSEFRDRPPKGWEQHYRRAPDAGSAPDTATAVRFRLCYVALQRNCVIDGDTFRFGGDKIRIADIDTPEIFSPKCSAEEALGQRAKHRLLELLNAGPIQLARIGDRDTDRYGRLLRVVLRDGRSLGDVLIVEGLARRWDGARRPWC
jgi:endonuclease YncB( thermonuclease family)